MKYFLRTLLRSIRYSLNRFIAIFAIVALGVGFFSGVKAAGPDMRLSMDAYYKKAALGDARLLTTLGFDEANVAAFKGLPGVDQVRPVKTADLLCAGGEGSVIRVLSLGYGDLEEGLNRPLLKEGRMLEKSGECLLDASMASSGYSIGDTISLADPNGDTGDTLERAEYTIVGTVQSPLALLTYSRGSSLIGKGSVDFYLYIPEEDFSLEAYTAVYVSSSGGHAAYSQDYQADFEALSATLAPVLEQQGRARYQSILNEGRAALDDAQRELNDAKAEADQKLADAAQDITDAQAKIEDGQAEIGDALTELEKGQREIDRNKRALADRLAQAQKTYQAEIVEGRAQLEASRHELEEARTRLAAAKAQLDTAQAQLDEKWSDYQAQLQEFQQNSAFLPPEQREQLQAQLDGALAQLEAGQGELDGQLAAYQEGERQYQSGLAQLETGEKALEAGEAQYQAGLAQLEQGRSALNSAQRKIDRGYAELEDARRELKDGEQELEDGRREYDQKRLEAQTEIADAQQKLDDAQKELEELEEPDTYVQSREDFCIGYSSFEDDSQRIENVARVFPVFFFLVAALVCLTTMTRMVDEQRTQIGTYKALGYSQGAVAGNYIAYALLATVTGSVAGLMVGFRLFPAVIFNTYGIMYVSTPLIAPFWWSYALTATLAAALCTGGASWWAGLGILKETPASMMRPKTPPPGKRVFLERITPLWRRMSFMKKVSARNLLRYKKRFFMTVVGIAGCTALMLCGFGLRDSINGVLDLQFNTLTPYDMTIAFDGRADPESPTGRALAKDARIESLMYTAQVESTAHFGQKSWEISVFVPHKGEVLPEFVLMRQRLGGREVEFKPGSIVLTEKAAKQLGVFTGQTITIDNDDGRGQFVVGGIIENYVAHYAYVWPEDYADQFGVFPKFNTAITKNTGSEAAFMDALSADIVALDDVATVLFMSGLIGEMDDMLSSLDYVVIVLILCAGLLALIVLYNLTNINVTERIREIATIKVLGFTDREVSMYIYRENTTITLIGTLMGLLLGMALHLYVILAAEVDVMMFGRSIALESFVWSALLTIAFSAAVNLFMYFRLKRVSMVESLKSVE